VVASLLGRDTSDSLLRDRMPTTPNNNRVPQTEGQPQHAKAPAKAVATETAEKETKGDQEKPMFEEFSLAPELIKRLKSVGFDHAFPVQAATFPFSLTGRDVIAKAFTGKSLSPPFFFSFFFFSFFAKILAVACLSGSTKTRF